MAVNSHIISTDHHEYFFYQIAELVLGNSVISVLINFVENIVDLFPGGIIDTDLFCNLN